MDDVWFADVRQLHHSWYGMQISARQLHLESRTHKGNPRIIFQVALAWQMCWACKATARWRQAMEPCIDRQDAV
jgi:hypothetical protein